MYQDTEANILREIFYNYYYLAGDHSTCGHCTSILQGGHVKCPLPGRVKIKGISSPDQLNKRWPLDWFDNLNLTLR